MKREEVGRIIRSSGLAHRADELIGLLKPSILLKTDPAPTTATSSQLGGVPSLPSGIEWPARADKPLHFLAQIRLDEASRFDESGSLPHKGMLYFFYDAEEQPWGFDPADEGSWRVIFSNEVPTDGRPAKTPDGMAIFQAVSLTFEKDYTLPPFGWDPGGYKVSESESEADSKLISAFHYGATIHRMLGHPQIVQNDMRLECELVSNGIYCGGGGSDPREELLRPNAANWQLLLQLDSDDDAGWMWGDVGRLYFMIRKSDLDARDFERTWLVLQCY